MNGLGNPGLGYLAHHLFWRAVDWFYPPTCATCGLTGARWCTDCRSDVKPLHPPICRICGDPIKKGATCDACATLSPPFTAMRSWAEFEDPVRKALHSLKYRSNMGLGEVLAQPLVEIILAESWPIEIVVPIPLSNEHLKERGYNQAALLAHPLALKLKLDYQPGSIRRIKETATQIHLSASERYTNLQDAFWANPATLKGKKVLLIDDVTTTGATMKSCADAVKKAGAQEIYCLTVARALKKYG